MAKRVASNTLDRSRAMLDNLNPGSVVLDSYGHAWQSDRIYWYRACGDSTQVSTWDLSYRGPFTVIHEATR